MSKRKNRDDEHVLVLDLKTLLVPLSIVISGICISISIYFGLKDSDSTTNEEVKGESTVVNNENNQNNDANQQQAAQQEVQDERPTTATVSIDDDAVLGNKDTAKVAIVEFSDPECPYCKRHHQETYGQIVEEYVNSGQVIYVFRDLPLSFHDPVATQEAIAAECARDLTDDSAYYKYLDLVFNNTGTNGAGVGGEAVLADFASQVGADKQAFTKCLDDEKFADEVKNDLADATAASITGSPGFVIGKLSPDGTVDGNIIRGAVPFAQFQTVIEKYL